jgi:site-specific recombinase XerD
MWHLLRRTYASVLAVGGIHRDVVEELMGHKRQGTTSLYAPCSATCMTASRRHSTACSAPTTDRRSQHER